MNAQKYGKTRRGRGRSAKEMQLDERMRRAFRWFVDDRGRIASRAVQETLEQRQACWRKMGKRVIEAKDAGVQREAVRALIHEFAQWADEVFAGNSPGSAA